MPGLKYVAIILMLTTCAMEDLVLARQNGVLPITVQTKMIKVNGVILNYIERGKGIPVVFVHGTLGDYRTWDGQIERLPQPARKSMMDNARELKGATLSPNMFPPIMCEDVRKVKAPTLLLDGERSPHMFAVINNMIERCLMNKERAMIPAASHGLEFQNPEAFNETVLAFLAKH